MSTGRRASLAPDDLSTETAMGEHYFTLVFQTSAPSVKIRDTTSRGFSRFSARNNFPFSRPPRRQQCIHAVTAYYLLRQLKKNICRDGEQEFCVPTNVQLSPQRKLIKIKTENNKNLPSLVGIFLSVYTIVVTVNPANENYYNARTTEFPSVIFYSRSKAETAVPSSQRASVATMLVGFFCKLLYEIVNVDCSVDARIETLGGNNVALSNAIYRLPITTQRHFD